MKQIRNIKKVVTPIDFSDNSRLIANSAAFMAGKFEASLHLVFVVQNFEDYSGFFVPQLHMPNLEEDLLVGAEERMSTFVSEFLGSSTILALRMSTTRCLWVMLPSRSSNIRLKLRPT